MTPDEAKAIDAAEFAADCVRARERAFALVAERRKRLAKWVNAAGPVVVPFNAMTRRPSGQSYTIGDQSHTIAEWSRITGVTESVIRGRLRCGWPIERAATQPVGRRGRPKAGVGKDFGDVIATGAPRHALDFSQLEISD